MLCESLAKLKEKVGINILHQCYLHIEVKLTVQLE
jgi:hypothetical protein